MLALAGKSEPGLLFSPSLLFAVIRAVDKRLSHARALKQELM